MIGNSMTAELFALRRRRAVWVLVGFWSAQILLFAYTISYVIYLSMGADFAAGQAEALLASLLPASVDHYIVGSMPIWGGPVMLIIGGMVSAGDYRNGTLRTILARFADRRALLLGRYAAVVLVMLIVSIISLVVGTACSTVVSLAEARPLVFPSFGQFLTAAGALARRDRLGERRLRPRHRDAQRRRDDRHRTGLDAAGGERARQPPRCARPEPDPGRHARPRLRRDRAGAGR
ncbi:ABC transporter permease [Catellatospora coxensis]